MEKFKVVAKPSEKAESGWARSFTVIRAGRGQAPNKQAEEENRQGSQTGTGTIGPEPRGNCAETPPYPQSGDQERTVQTWTKVDGSGTAPRGAGPPTNAPKSGNCPSAPLKSASWIDDPGSDTRSRSSGPGRPG